MLSVQSSVVGPATKRAELIDAAKDGDLYYIVTNVDSACKVKTKNGETLLHLAAENGHIDIVRILIQADPLLVCVCLVDTKIAALMHSFVLLRSIGAIAWTRPRPCA